MSESLLASIIIPLFNQVEYTQKCLISLEKSISSFQQQYTEVILVDNGSNDGTQDFLKDFAFSKMPIKKIINELNLGYSKANNQGARIAEGKYLVLLNNDIEAFGGWLEQLLIILESDSKVGIVGSKLLFPDRTIQHAGVYTVAEDVSQISIGGIHAHYLAPDYLPIANVPRQYRVVTGACLAIRSELFHQVGGLDEIYWNGNEDVDLCFKVGELGYKIIFQPKSILIHHASKSGPERFSKVHENELRLIEKWSGRIDLDYQFTVAGETNRLSLIPAYRPGILVLLEINVGESIILQRIEDLLMTLSVQDCLVLSGTGAIFIKQELDNLPSSKLKNLCEIKLDSSSKILTQFLNTKDEIEYDYAAFVQSYGIFYDGWIELLYSQLIADESCAIVGPLLENSGNVQSAERHFSLRPENRRIIASINQYRDKNNQSCLVPAVIDILLIRRKAIQELDGFLSYINTPELALFMCWKLREAGYRLRLALDVFIGGQRHGQNPKPPMNWQNLYKSLELEAQTLAVSELWGFESDFQATQCPRKTSIIMLTLNQLHYTKKCIESLFSYTPSPFELIVVDNGSTDQTVEYLKTLQSQHPGIVRTIFNKSNLGFARGNNQGLAMSEGDYILLLNNDTVLTPGWLENLRIPMEQYPEVGAVGPMSNCVAGLQLIDQPLYDQESLEDLNTYSYLLAKTCKRQIQFIDRVIGFCMLLKREVIEWVGGLDPSYGLGNFEDDDFCLRIRIAGFRIAIARDVFVHHFGNRTFIGEKIDYSSSLEKNWEYFKEKWSLPEETSLTDGYDFNQIQRRLKYDLFRDYVDFQDS